MSPSPPERRRRPRGATLLHLFALLVLLALLAQLAQHSLLRRARAGDDAAHLARRALRWYLRVLHYYPLASRAASAGAIFFCADASGQVLSAVVRGAGVAQVVAVFDWARLVRYSFYGLSVMGPFLYAWYAVMNEMAPENGLRGALLKALFEQVTLEPACIAMYLVYEGAVCRSGVGPTLAKIRAKFGPLWVKNAIFWVPANFSNYYIGTPDLRVLFANLCSIFWNIYFSIKVNAPAPVPSDPKRVGAFFRSGGRAGSSVLPTFSRAPAGGTRHRISPERIVARRPEERDEVALGASTSAPIFWSERLAAEIEAEAESAGRHNVLIV